MKIAFLGDSLTAANDWQKAFPDVITKNFGVRNEKTNDISKRLKPVIDFEPNKIFILMGINDLGEGFKTEKILKNYRLIIEVLQKELPDCSFFIQSLLPVNKLIFKNERLLKTEILKMNEELTKLAKELNCSFINLHKKFTDNNGRLDKKLTYDGLHLNSEAYKIWNETIQQFNNLTI